MTIINLTTHIKAPIKDVFEKSTDIDFHKKSVSQTQETAISGVTLGLIKGGEKVTWRGKHFGVWLTHTSLISAYEAPTFFVDKMIEGNFKSFRHEHSFSHIDGVTIMNDEIIYETPFGIFGKLFDKLLLKKHLTELIEVRNKHIKDSLEVVSIVK